MLKKYTLAFARTCSYGTEHHQVGTWMLETGMSLGRHPRIDKVWAHVDTRYRIHNSRNWCARWALEKGVDYLCFIDGDMHADFRLFNQLLPEEAQPDARRWARPFLQSSLEFMWQSDAGVVAAPAVSGPPDNKINVFVADESDMSMARLKHEELRNQSPCFMRVCAIGTGLMLIDMDVFRKLPEPWFEDLEDDKKYEVIHSQDCHFCVKCNQIEIPVYANLFAPARHIKFQGQDPPCWEQPCQSPSTATTATRTSSPSPAATRNPASSPSKVSLWLPSRSQQDSRATSAIAQP